MADRSQSGAGRGIRLEEFEEFAHSIARQVWSQDERLKEQQEQLALTHIEWLYRNYPEVVNKSFADRHLDLWRWAVDLTPGISPPAKAVVWPRGGAKSSTTELIVAYVGQKGTRKFGLYVSGTQDQANDHVQTIADHFEEIGMDRAINKYGQAKGWGRARLRAANGFSCVAIGLDKGVRGIKLGRQRPDFIIFDDVDDHEDTPKTVLKKERTITSSILAAGSIDVAVLFAQNLIHEGSVLNRIIEGHTDLLLDREPVEVIPAVYDLEVEREELPSGANRWRIVGGRPSWDGQDLTVCEQQINRWGLRVFKREAQQEVKSIEGIFFNVEVLETVGELPPLPEIVDERTGQKRKQFYRFARWWDLAGTQDGGDWTVGVLLALAPHGVLYIVDVKRHQFEPSKVRELIAETCERDAKGEVWEQDEYEDGKLVRKGRYLFSFADQIDGRVSCGGPQDPSQAGKDQAQQLEKAYAKYGFRTKPVTGKKAKRAETLAEWLNKANVKMLRAVWNFTLKEEFRLFREDESHLEDDIVDSAADGTNDLVGDADQTFQIW